MDGLVEQLAQKLHADWLKGKVDAGVPSRPDPNGHEQILPWDQLHEDVKEANRRQARTAIDGIISLGYAITKT
jgi:hypothetical protein